MRSARACRAALVCAGVRAARVLRACAKCAAHSPLLPLPLLTFSLSCPQYLAVRRELVDYVAHTAERLQLDNDTVHMAIAYVDRVRARVYVQNGPRLILTAVACLIVAAKFLETCQVQPETRNPKPETRNRKAVACLVVAARLLEFCQV